MFFSVVGPLRFYPPYPRGHVIPNVLLKPILIVNLLVNPSLIEGSNDIWFYPPYHRGHVIPNVLLKPILFVNLLVNPSLIGGSNDVCMYVINMFVFFSGQEVYPPYPLSGPTTKKNFFYTTKKNFFMCVFPKGRNYFTIFSCNPPPQLHVQCLKILVIFSRLKWRCFHFYWPISSLNPPLTHLNWTALQSWRTTRSL